MIVTIDQQMDPFSKYPKVFITLSLFLILCSYNGNSFSSAFLTMLVLAFSTSFLFLLAKMRQICMPNTMEKPQELQAGLRSPPQDEILEGNEATQEGEGKLPLDEVVLRSSKQQREGLKGDETDGNALLNGSNSSDKQLSENPSPPGCFPCCSLSDDESLPENAGQLLECSECSISDEDNLIEIVIPQGHHVAPEEPSSQLKPELKGVLLPVLPPETACRQLHGLMDSLSEINEEDNLIEIDIARGSIKCSRVGTKVN